MEENTSGNLLPPEVHCFALTLFSGTHVTHHCWDAWANRIADFPSAYLQPMSDDVLYVAWFSSRLSVFDRCSLCHFWPRWRTIHKPTHPHLNTSSVIEVCIIVTIMAWCPVVVFPPCCHTRLMIQGHSLEKWTIWAKMIIVLSQILVNSNIYLKRLISDFKKCYMF